MRPAKGWVKEHKGQYYDALHPHVKNGIVKICLVESQGGIAPPTKRIIHNFAKEVGSPSVGCPQDPKKEKKKEMGHPRSQHFVLASRDIESVTRREGRWGFSKVYPWNGRIQP